MNKTEICLVRHGETLWNKESRMQGSQDIALSTEGIKQAKLVAQRLKQETWHAIYSSDLMRAYDTAKWIHDAMGRIIPHVVDQRLRERHYGSLEGLTRDEILQRYPEFYLQSDQMTIPGVEKQANLRQRIYQALTDIAQAQQGKRVIVVTHGGTIRAFLYTISQDISERIGNTAITRITFDGKNWIPLCINDTSHLTRLKLPY